MAKPALSPEQAIVHKSGHAFHSRAVRALRELGWDVLVGPYYSDNFTDKPREIDIIAERHFPYDNHFQNLSGDVVVRLFIECKYISGATVFWFDAKDRVRAADRITRDTNQKDPLLSGFGKKHHYLADVPVAKLAASEGGRSEENEAISRAINQNLNALIYYRHETSPIWTGFRRKKVLGRLVYPLIIVNSFEKFFSTDMGGAPVATPIAKPFQLEVNYAYTDQNRNAFSEYFLIDVLSLEGLANFLASLEQTDVNALMETFF